MSNTPLTTPVNFALSKIDSIVTLALRNAGSRTYSIFKRFVAALSLMFVVALPASAVTIGPGDIGSTVFGQEIVSDSVVSIDFTNNTGSSIILSEISLISVGGSDDVPNVQFGLVTPDTNFAFTFAFGPIGLGIDSTLPDINLADGETFSVFFGGDVDAPVGVAVGTEVSAAPPVTVIPLPAGALLIISGFGILAQIRRRRTK